MYFHSLYHLGKAGTIRFYDFAVSYLALNCIETFQVVVVAVLGVSLFCQDCREHEIRKFQWMIFGLILQN